MSEGPFKPEDFKEFRHISAAHLHGDTISISWLANAHPFVKEARELAEIFSRFEIHFKSEGGIFRPDLGYTKMENLSEGRTNPAKEFLAKWFPEKKESGE